MARFIPVADLVERYKEQLEQIVKHLAFHGYVVTIDSIPNIPLAMGNYRSEVTIRPARSNYAAGQRGHTEHVTPWAPQAADGAYPGPIQMLDPS